MDIFEQLLTISQIKDIKKGTTPISEVKCRDRYSDCFVYVLSGKADYFFTEGKATATAGSIIFLAHHSNYDIKVEVDDYRYIFIDFYFSADSKSPLQNGIYSCDSIRALENNFIKLNQFWHEGNFADRIYCHSLLYSIYSTLATADMHEYIPSAKREQIKKAVNEITASFFDPDISIAALSRQCSMSEVHFRRLFHRIYHTSPMEFIISLRIEKAKELLTNTDNAIGNISELCGFNSAYYFSKLFKKSTGVTPSYYRRSSREL